MQYKVEVSFTLQHEDIGPVMVLNDRAKNYS